MNVLLVDDFEPWRRMVRRILIKVPGVEVSEAEGYDDALRLARVVGFDLLVDLRLADDQPDLAGFRLLESLVAEGRAGRFVIVAGATDDREAETLRVRAMALGAWGFWLEFGSWGVVVAAAVPSAGGCVMLVVGLIAASLHEVGVSGSAGLVMMESDRSYDADLMTIPSVALRSDYGFGGWAGVRVGAEVFATLPFFVGGQLWIGGRWGGGGGIRHWTAIRCRSLLRRMVHTKQGRVG